MRAGIALLPLLGALLWIVWGAEGRAHRWLLALALGLGAFAVLPLSLGADFLEAGVAGFARRAVMDGVVRAFVAAAMPEETCKFVVLLLLLSFAKKPLSPRAALMAGALAGLGFASCENVVYALGPDADLTFVRWLTALPCHVCLGAVMAGYLAMLRATRRPLFFLKAWLVPVFLHGLYDMPLLTAPAVTLDGGAGAIMLSGLVLALASLWARHFWIASGRFSPA